MRRTGWKWAVVMAGWLALEGKVLAQSLVITSFTGNGTVQWTNSLPGTESYRIEWAANLAIAKWTDLASGLRGLAPTSATMTAEVPMFYRIKALGPSPENMVYIPPGTFRMGDNFAEGSSIELPVHDVYVSGFYMDRYEVTKALWDEVVVYAAGHGYDVTAGGGSGKAPNHPVQTVTWYEAVKWCNARSQHESLVPCYYIDPFLINVYKTGDVDISNAWVNWSANGYRLPTEAEWEKAARGGASGYRFPCADNTISHGRANYNAVGGESYDLSNGTGFHPAYTNGGFFSAYTSPIGAFTPNGYGLYDMDGNVWEWCWDWSGGYPATYQTDPCGPTGVGRILRSGVYCYAASDSRCSKRANWEPKDEASTTGFRCARRP